MHHITSPLASQRRWSHLAPARRTLQVLLTLTLTCWSLVSLAQVSQGLTDFETFADGSVNLQGEGSTTTSNSYTIADPYGSLWTLGDEWGLSAPSFDEEIKDDGTGNQVWRLSNAVTTSSFSALPYSPSSAQAAGETTAALWNDRGSNHTTPLNPANARAYAATEFFHAAFSFKSATDAGQAGLSISTSAAPRQSSIRQTFVSISDDGTSGLSLGFYDTDATANFAFTSLATGLAYDQWHQVDVYVEFLDGLGIDGSGNDVVRVLIDGQLIHTGTTWESYYNSLPGSFPLNPYAVDALMFRVSGTAQPSLAGGGLYFDDVVIDNAPFPVPGCTNPAYAEYDASATTDDGTCETAIVYNVSSSTAFASIQEAIDAAVAGDSIVISNGTYVLTSTLEVNEEVVLHGESAEGVILDATAMTPLSKRVIETDANNITLRNLTIKPIADPDPTANNNIGFTVKVGSNSVPAINSNIVLENIAIDGAPERTPFDFHGVDGLTLTNLSASGTTRGNGMSFSGCTNVTVNSFSGTGNLWGSIAVYASRFVPAEGRGSSNITINGDGLDIDGSVFSQDDLNPTSGDLYNTNIAVTGWDYVVFNDDFRGAFNDSEEYTFFLPTESDAIASALSLQAGGNSSSTIQQVSTSHWLVANGMTIGEALSDATAGDVIEVRAGTYDENVVVDKAIDLRGPNQDVACGARAAEAAIAPASGLPISVVADGVSINGFEITAPSYQYAVVCGNTSDLTLAFNHIHDINSSASPASTNTHAIQYTVGNSPAETSNVSIVDNCFTDIASANLTGKSASAISFLQSTTTGTLTGLSIERNAISNVVVNDGAWPTGKIAYGILLNAGGGSGYLTSTGKIVNAVIADNVISGLGGHIATAIGLEGNAENASVTGNDVSNLSATKSADRAGGGLDLQALKFENNRFVGTATVENNRFAAETFTHGGTSGLGYAVANYVPADNGGVANVSCNWLGSEDLSSIVDNEELNGRVLAKDGAAISLLPFLTDDTDDDAAAGFQPVEGACDGVGPVVNLTQDVSYFTIQAALDAATDGDVIEVAAGTYAELINFTTDNVTLQSADGAATTTITGTAGSGELAALVRFSADGCTIDGFTLDHEESTATTARIIGAKSSDGTTITNCVLQNSQRAFGGDWYGSPSNITFDSNTFQNVVRAISNTENINGMAVTDNTFNAVGNGIRLAGMTGDITVSGNVFTEVPVGYYYKATTAATSAYPALENVLANNTFLMNVSFADVAGGSYVDGVFATLAEAIDDAEAGAELNIAAGTLAVSSQINVDKSLTIQGAGQEATTIDGSGIAAPGYGFWVTASSVALKDFAFNGGGATGLTYGLHFQPGTSDLALENLSISACGINAIAMNGVNGQIGANTITNVTTSGNGLYGLGLGAAQNVTVSGFTSASNAGGDIGIYGSDYSSQTTSDLVFNEPLTLQGGFTLTKLPEPYTISYSTADATDADYLETAAVRVPAAYDQAFHADRAAGATYPAMQFVGLTTESAIAATVGIFGQLPEYSGLAVRDLGQGQWEVFPGLTIQNAVNRADEGDLIDVAAGTYTENVVVDKRLTLDGAGETSILNAAGKAITVTASGASETDRLVIRDFAFSGPNASGGGDAISFEPASGGAHVTVENISSTGYGAGVHFRTGTMTDARILNSTFDGNGNGVRVASAVTSMDGLTVDNCTMSNNLSSAFSSNPSGTVSNVNTNYTISNTTFTNNSTAGTSNQHDLSFFGFTGNATLTNVTVTSGNGSAANADAHGIVFTRGGSEFSPLGTVTLNNVTVQGHVGKGALSFQQYSDVSGVSLTDVDVADCNAPWGQLILAHTDADAFAVGNTELKSLVLWQSGGADATSAVVRNAVTDAVLDRDVVADGFAAENQIGHKIDLSALGLVQWKANELFVTATSFAAPYTTAPSIQRAADAASAGFTVHVDAGTYPESVTTAVPLTLQGAGATTIIEPTSGNALTLAAGTDASNRTVVKDLKVTGGARGITAGGFTTLENVESSGNSGAGLWLNAGEDLVLTNCQFDGNNLGVKIPSTVSFDDIVITGSSFDDNTQHGWYSDANSGTEPSLDNVSISGTSFSGNGTKGLYTERLSNATLTNLTVSGNGGNGGGVIGQGIDLNLKWADYANISVTNSAFSNNGLGQTMGAALAIKARDDGSSYGANPATLANVTLTGNTFSGDERAIMLGEPDKSNAGPTNVTISNNSFPDAVQFAVVNHSATEVELTCNWHDAASIPGLNATISGNIDLASALLEGTDGDAAAGFQPSGTCATIGGCAVATACNYEADLAFPDADDCEYTSCAGCMLSTACNYDDSATIADNASCEFDDALGVCGGTCTADGNNDGVCDDQASGCTDSSACNYDAFAGVDDGNCEYASCTGCTVASACNYDASATIANAASCIYPDGCETCSGATDGTGTVVDNDADDDGFCDADEVEGCTDPTACDYDEDATEQTTCDYISCSGCTLIAACNYNAAATISNNASCVFPESSSVAGSCDTCSGETDGTGVVVDNDDDNDGWCNDDEVEGCTQEGACNFDPDATDDDQSCEFTSCAGCTLSAACNYDASATIPNNATCTFPESSGIAGSCDTCSGETDGTGTVVDNDADDDGFCDDDEVLGCTEEGACNFNPAATEENNSCEYTSCIGCLNPVACNYDATATISSACTFPAAFSDCDGCLNDVNDNYICDELEVQGCMDPTATNYNPSAAVDDGSCEITIVGCIIPVALNYNPAATVQGIPFLDFCTFPPPSGSMPGPGMSGLPTAGCTVAIACNYDPSATEDDGFCDYVTCQGCTNPAACDFDEDATIPTGCSDFSSCYGCTNPSACNFDASNIFNDGSCEYSSCLGCTDNAACNYNSAALINASCLYPVDCETCSGETDGTGTVVDGDADNDEVCDGDEVPGCMNNTACNYNPLATDSNGTCEYETCSGCMNTDACNYNAAATISEPAECLIPTGCQTCNGTAIADGDADNDGVCDVDEVAGCTNSAACNYNINATDSDGSCEFATCSGCMNSTACNYNAAATVSDAASCEFPSGCETCSGATDGSGMVVDNDDDNDGICNADEIDGCTNATACNYNINATDNDGSCEFTSCVGCTDATACNYDSDASINAGCAYASGCDTCSGATDGTGMVVDGDSDNDNICDVNEVAGCQTLGACNYNPDATDSAACDFTSCQGCTDNTACNYDATATQSDGSCTYPPAGYDDCAGTVCTDINNNSVCDFDESPDLGCLNSTACNYDAAANTSDPNNPCTFLVFSGFSSVTAASSNAAADGSVTPIIGGTGGSGTYFLTSETPEPQVSNDGTKVYLFTDVTLSGNLASSSWNALPAGRYDFGLVDDAGCEAVDSHRVLVPALAP